MEQSSEMYPRPILNPGYHPTTSPGHLSYMLLDPVGSYPGSAPGELLTPQSDQQESANSDEVVKLLHQDLRMIQVRPWGLSVGIACPETAIVVVPSMSSMSQMIV